MKKIITILMLLIGLTAYCQSNITNVMNEVCAFDGCTNFKLGCCEDGLSHNNASCVNPGWKEYYVTEDIHFSRDTLTLRDGRIEFRDGKNFFTNGAVIIKTCGANISFTGGGGMFSSVEQMNATLKVQFFKLIKSLPIGKPYKIIDVNGRAIRKGIVNAYTKDIRSQDQVLILWVKGYRPAKIPF